MKFVYRLLPEGIVRIVKMDDLKGVSYPNAVPFGEVILTTKEAGQLWKELPFSAFQNQPENQSSPASASCYVKSIFVAILKRDLIRRLTDVLEKDSRQAYPIYSLTPYELYNEKGYKVASFYFQI